MNFRTENTFGYNFPNSESGIDSNGTATCNCLLPTFFSFLPQKIAYKIKRQSN